MNGLTRKYIYDRIERIDDEMDELKERLAVLQEDRDGLQSEIDKEEMEDLNKQYERSV